MDSEINYYYRLDNLSLLDHIYLKSMILELKRRKQITRNPYLAINQNGLKVVNCKYYY